MASRNVPSIGQDLSEIQAALKPILSPLLRAISFVFSSFFRFMIFLGIVLLIASAMVAEGVVAGHLGIYGGTAVLAGVVGRIVIHWKLKDT